MLTVKRLEYQHVFIGRIVNLLIIRQQLSCYTYIFVPCYILLDLIRSYVAKLRVVRQLLLLPDFEYWLQF